MQRKLLAALLVAGTLLLYAPVLHHDFIFGMDDNKYITQNSHVISGLRPANVAWAFTTLQPFYWHPITWLSHMADCQLFGLNSGAHHYVNVLIHAVNVLLLFLLLNWATGSVGPSFVVAALFAVHPMNVETVAWAAERKSLLSAMFSLATIAAYGWYVKRRNWKRYLVVLAGFCLALMSKPMAVTLPVVLLLLDYWPLERCDEIPSPRQWVQLVVEKVPLLLVGLGISAITVFGEREGGTLVSLSTIPMRARVVNAVISYAAYIQTALWPSHLSVFYPHPAIMDKDWQPLAPLIVSAAILAAITGLVLYFHRARYLVFGWLLYLLTLFPLIGLIQSGFQARQDHFTYIPSIGLFIILAWGGAAVSAAVYAALFEKASMPRAIPLLVSVCLIAGYAAVTTSYLPYWQNGVKLYARARAEAGPPHPWTEWLYANALLHAGQVDEALAHYRESCTLGPGNEFCHYSIADILFDRHEFRGALEEYQNALMVTNKKEVAVGCLDKSGEALVQLGEYDAAQRSFANALSIAPGDATALRMRQLIYSRTGGEN
jgi:hypothetical protein